MSDYYLVAEDEHGHKWYWNGRRITALRKKAKEYIQHGRAEAALKIIKKNIWLPKIVQKLMIDWD